MPIPSSRPFFFALLLALAFVAGGASPLRAGTSAEDGIVRQLERLTDAVKDLAHRDPARVVCECRSGS